MKTSNVSIARILSIYWVVLWQHNFAPWCESWNWIGGNHLVISNQPWIATIITSLTMPTCFFISGMLFEYSKSYNKEPFDFFTKKIKRILLPCVVLGCIFQLLTQHTINTGQIGGYAHFWFLWDLFIYFVVIYSILKLCTKYGYILLIVFALFVYLMPSGLLYPQIEFVLKYWFGYFVYFVGGGIYCLTYSHLTKKNRTAVNLALAAYIVLQSVMAIDSDLILVFKLLAIMVLLIEILSITPKSVSKNSVFSIIDRTSFGVYVFNMFWLFILYSILKMTIDVNLLIENRYWLSTVVSLFTIPLSILTTLLFQKYIKWMKI